MRISGQWLSGAVVVMTILLGSVRPALADSYTVFGLGSDNGHRIYGIDTAGDVVVWNGNGCDTPVSTCYVTYTNGIATSQSATAPDLVYDDGTSCDSTPAGFNASKSVCNNGWIGLGTLYNPNGNPNGVYVGSGSDLRFLHSGSADQIFLNSLGDLAWTDGVDDELYVAIANYTPRLQTGDLSFEENSVAADPTPEPGSLLLVVTGLLLFIASVRRKANGQPSSYID